MEQDFVRASALLIFFFAVDIACAGWTGWLQVSRYWIHGQYIAVEFPTAIPQAVSQGCSVPNVIAIPSSSPFYNEAVAIRSSATLTKTKVAFYIDSCLGAPSYAYGQFSSLYVDTQQ